MTFILLTILIKVVVDLGVCSRNIGNEVGIHVHVFGRWKETREPERNLPRLREHVKPHTDRTTLRILGM